MKKALKKYILEIIDLNNLKTDLKGNIIHITHTRHINYYILFFERNLMGINYIYSDSFNKCYLTINNPYIIDEEKNSHIRSKEIIVKDYDIQLKVWKVICQFNSNKQLNLL